MTDTTHLRKLAEVGLLSPGESINLLDTIDRLTAERDALARDAARWKMYCTGTIYAEWDYNEEDGTLSHIYLATLGGDKRDGEYFTTLAQFEAVIDAAIAKEQP